MSNFIREFDTKTQRNSYEQGSSFKAPYVSLSENELKYLSGIFVDKSQAEVGDIVVEGKFIVPKDKYSLVKNMVTPIGIVGIKASNTPDNKVRVIGLNILDGNNPQGAPDDDYNDVYYGGYGCGDNYGHLNGDDFYIDFPILQKYNEYPCINTSGSTTLQNSIQRTVGWGYFPSDRFDSKESLVEGYGYNSSNSDNYLPAPYLADGTVNPLFTATSYSGGSIANPFSDFNGLTNTQVILKYLPETPKDEDYYDSADETMKCAPAAYLCNNYKKGGLKWYLPAAGELALIIAKQSIINNTRKMILDSEDDYQGYLDCYCWTSTQYSSDNACSYYFNYGYTNINDRDSGNCVVPVSAF